MKAIISSRTEVCIARTPCCDSSSINACKTGTNGAVTIIIMDNENMSTYQFHLQRPHSFEVLLEQNQKEACPSIASFLHWLLFLKHKISMVMVVINKNSSLLTLVDGCFQVFFFGIPSNFRQDPPLLRTIRVLANSTTSPQFHFV